MSEDNPVDFTPVPGLVLYHGLASTCSKKVRIALMEKGLPFTSRLMNLQKFEHFDPRYLQIHPGGVVPALVFDGSPVIESSVIVEFIDEQFPQVPLSPREPLARARMRVMKHFADTFAYDAVYMLTWMRLSAPAAQRLSSEELAAVLAKVPTAERRERWATVASEGFTPAQMKKSADDMRTTLKTIDEWASHGGDWLLPEQYSLADLSLIPFVQRIFNLSPELASAEAGYPALAGWYQRMLGRPAVKRALFFDEDPRAASMPNV
jgi:glutathione S-transferase